MYMIEINGSIEFKKIRTTGSLTFILRQRDYKVKTSTLDPTAGEIDK